jgi:hypothetical protein
MDCICCDPGERCRGLCPTARVLFAADALNKANVRDANNVGTRNGLYRDNMNPEARSLDEAFQAYYRAQQPSTEINAADIGFTLKSDKKTMDAIAEDVARNAPPRAMR